MNKLISVPSVQFEVVNDNFCRHCGSRVLARDNFCGGCGTGCQDLIEVVDANSETSIASVGAGPSQVVASSSGLQAVETVLNNRLAVIGIIAFIGPLGFPALWFSPRFSRPTKVITTVSYLLLTAVLPIVIAVYWLEYSIRPLLEAFGK